MRLASLAPVLLALAAGAQAGVVLTPPTLRLEPVAGGFSAPLGLRHAGDGRLFVVEQGGRVHVLAGGQRLPIPFIALAGDGASTPPLGFSSGGERGLLGLAFAPDHADSRALYLFYTDAAGDSVLARYRVFADDRDRVDPATAEVILRIDQDFANHNGGDLHFDADGMLVIAVGDGGSGNDPCNRAQTLRPQDLIGAADGGGGNDCAADGAFVASGGNPDSRALLGALLRIDVGATTPAGAGGTLCAARADGSASYAIPADNPFPAALAGACAELWQVGLRNPWRFSFDRVDRTLLIGDVGQSAREEVNATPGSVGGLNFGWRCREGDIAGANTSLCGEPPPFVEPVLVYPRTLGGSITGGFRYRGLQASLQGLYFYADFVSGRHFAARENGGLWSSVVWRDAGGNWSSFGEDMAGELYAINYSNGCVYRLQAERIFADGYEPSPAPGC